MKQEPDFIGEIDLSSIGKYICLCSILITIASTVFCLILNQGINRIEKHECFRWQAEEEITDMFYTPNEIRESSAQNSTLIIEPNENQT